MCNHSFKLPTKTPDASLHNHNLHPKAHDTHFPLSSPKKPTPKRAHKRPTGRPGPACSASKLHEGAGARRGETSGILQSFAMVKSSSEPRKEFRESMMEMIEENKLTSLKGFEELLECYLCLNSKEYHGVIVEVFEEIWFDVIELNVEFGV